MAFTQHDGRREMTIRAVLFDAAGTLIHIREPVGETYARLAREYGVDVSADRIGRAFRLLFPTMPAMVFPGATSAAQAEELERQWWHELVSRVFASIHHHQFPRFEEYFDRLFAYFAGAGAWVAADDAIATLDALRARGLRTGIVSNFDHRLPNLLAGLGLVPLLDVVVRPADAGAAKPDPRIFAMALARLAVAPGQAIYVGDDEEEDIAGAARAGMAAIQVGALPNLFALVAHLEAAPPKDCPPDKN